VPATLALNTIKDAFMGNVRGNFYYPLYKANVGFKFLKRAYDSRDEIWESLCDLPEDICDLPDFALETLCEKEILSYHRVQTLRGPLSRVSQFYTRYIMPMI
jgi:hypothetical protein